MQNSVPAKTQGVATLRDAIRHLPTNIGRLVYLARQLDPDTGRYQCRMGQADASPAALDALLRGLHDEAFATWLKYPLDEQRADLDLYFSGLPTRKTTAIETWIRLQSYLSLIPASATMDQRQLFSADMRALLHAMIAVDPARPRDLSISAPAGFLKVKQVSTWLGVSPRTVRAWAETGFLPCVKIGRQWRFSGDSVREWLRTRTTTV